MAIRHKRKNSSGYTWQAADLVDGQIGLNTADATLHLKSTDGIVFNFDSFELVNVASANLLALRCVVSGVSGWEYATTATAGHSNQACFLLESAANVSALAKARINGFVFDAGWSWDVAKPIWLGTDGQLTQTAPTSGFVRVVALPVSATTLIFDGSKPGVVLA